MDPYYPRDGRNPALSLPEAIVFGNDAQLHPITKMPLEQGSGAHSPRDQAFLVHLPEIARLHGKAAADAMRQKLIDADNLTAAQTAEAAAKAALARDGVSVTSAEKAS
jgi:hypothetical protein